MRPVFPAAVLLALFPACSSATPRGPNPADKPGGATNMQPGSGGTYRDVVRSQEGIDPDPEGERPTQPQTPPPEPRKPEPPRGTP